uniref:Importin N-terminal domain-containing protein n=1 Tax=Prasinoderma coloniale TaxID=156133 RepID=A0A7R9T9Y0_9VIRI|eukprot:PRCOL_00000785-RA
MAAAGFDVTAALRAAQDANIAVRQQAEATLKQFQETAYPQFMQTMCTHLAGEENPVETRQLAGLLLKNTLTAKDEARRAEAQQKWSTLDQQGRTGVKQMMVTTLGSPNRPAASTAAQVVSKIAAIEFPHKMWPELVPNLLYNMNEGQASLTPEQGKNLKQGTLEALGYICEEVADPDVMDQASVNSMLTAIMEGMRKEMHADVRVAATIALNNALEFAHHNFEVERERDYVMQGLCDCTGAPEAKLREEAFLCLVNIVGSYYKHMQTYLAKIFEISSRSIKQDEQDVMLAAIELWVTFAQEEIEIQEEIQEIQEGGAESQPPVLLKFIEQALASMVPLLLANLTKQDEHDEDDDEWNESKASARCLGLVSECAGDAVVPLVLPYVQEGLTKPDWRAKEAATMAFSQILEGPAPATLQPLVQQALPVMLQALKDPNIMVKDSTAWTIGRICEVLHGFDPPVLNAAAIEQLLRELLPVINDTPSVAEKVCWAIHQLAAGFTDASPLTPFFYDVAKALLATADRPVERQSRLRTTAYETLNELITVCADDCLPLVQQLLPAIMQKLEGTFAMQVATNEQREEQSELQGLLSGVLAIIMQKLSAKPQTAGVVRQSADKLMELFLRVFACRSASVHEEAMLAIGQLADAIEGDFLKHMNTFYPYLETGLKNFGEYQVCALTVGVVSDLTRALEKDLLPYCDGIIMQLLKNLESNDLHRSVKPAIISCFGDIALAIGTEFEKYLPYVLNTLKSASVLAMSEDDDLYDFVIALRQGIFEAYSAILQAFTGSGKLQHLQVCIEPCLEFMQRVYADSATRDEDVNKAALGVLGDMASAMGKGAAPAFQSRQPFIQAIINDFGSGEHAETARWAQSVITQACS